MVEFQMNKERPCLILIFLTANQAYVAHHGDLRLPVRPKTQVAIVTRSSRLHVAPALGLALGDAHILRNAGGRDR